MEPVTIALTDERMIKALNTFSAITGVDVSAVVDTEIIETLLKTYLVDFFTQAMMSIDLGKELRHPDIVTFVATCKKESYGTSNKQV